MNEPTFHPLSCICDACQNMRRSTNPQAQTQAQGQLKFDPWSVQHPCARNPKPITLDQWTELEKWHDYWKNEAWRLKVANRESETLCKEYNSLKQENIELLNSRDEWKVKAEKADHWKKSVEYWENKARKFADNAAHWEKLASMHLNRKAKLEEFYELYIKHDDARKAFTAADKIRCKTAEDIITYGNELAALDDSSSEDDNYDGE